mgnify:CR=1 FL=1
MFDYSRGRDKFDNTPAQRSAVDFFTFASEVLQDRGERKGQTYICSPLNGDGRRCADGALPRAWLPLDLDGIDGPEAYSDLIAHLHRYQGFAYTTASHTPDKPRCRVVLALSRAVTRDEGKAIGPALETRLHAAVGTGRLKFDPSVYRGEQPVYTPLRDAQHYLFDGQPLDVIELLAEVKPDPPPGKEKPAAEVTAATLVDLRSALDAMPADDRELWVKVGHALKTIGDPGRELWLAWSSKSAKHDADADARLWETFQPSKIDHRCIFVLAAGHGWANTVERPPPPEVKLAPITPLELHAARLTPRKILPDLIYADVRTRFAAGGTGKTTLALYEAAVLALGRSLYGRTPERPVRTVFVTREDTREILVARLREIMKAMHLSADEIRQVLENVLVLDKSGDHFRLSEVVRDVVAPHHVNIAALGDALEEWQPDWLLFDPLVSFGVGEQRVNDAEQGLIEAFRIMRNRLDCCVEGIHHSGKQNARDKTLDQYSGRGGSALSDGARMVAVLQPLDAAEWLKATGSRLLDGESGLVMALPKLSYAKQQPSIFLRRHGYAFTQEIVQQTTPEQAARERADQVHRFLLSEYRQGRRYGVSDLDTCTRTLNLSRSEIREAASALKVAGRVMYHHASGKTGSHYEPLTAAEPDGRGRPETGGF